MPFFFKHFWILLIIPIFLGAQVMEEVNPPPNIKTIVFTGPTEDQFPIVRQGDKINLSFDDLTASEQDYYYKVVHCNYDWTPSQLLKSQYLNGVDNQRIIDYANSYTTLQPYSNYRLTLPNNEVGLKVSGNYVLEIYNMYNELQFSRRFVVYRDLVTVGGVAKRSRDFDFLNERQSVQFTINTAGFQVVNPKVEIKIALLKNYHWPTAKYNIKPQFTIGQELVYRYDKETSFMGGNEFLNFDTKDLRAPSFAISKIELLELYQHYLFTNEYRYDQEYTFFPDINGDFIVRTLQGTDVDREAEYTKVHFSLPFDSNFGLYNVYVTGKFNNYILDEENRMEYNAETGNFELAYPFKQGFYNYKYVVVKDNGVIDENLVSGNFHFTENNYVILVYYRNFGDLYDGIIGVGNVNSGTITN